MKVPNIMNLRRTIGLTLLLTLTAGGCSSWNPFASKSNPHKEVLDNLEWNKIKQQNLIRLAGEGIPQPAGSPSTRPTRRLLPTSRRTSSGPRVTTPRVFRNSIGERGLGRRKGNSRESGRRHLPTGLSAAQGCLPIAFSFLRDSTSSRLNPE